MERSPLPLPQLILLSPLYSNAYIIVDGWMQLKVHMEGMLMNDEDSPLIMRM